MPGTDLDPNKFITNAISFSMNLVSVDDNYWYGGTKKYQFYEYNNIEREEYKLVNNEIANNIYGYGPGFLYEIIW